jgi:hypothetical protein
MTINKHTLSRTLAAGTAALVVAGGGAGAALACNGHQSNGSGASYATFRHAGFDHGWGGRSNTVTSAITVYLNLPSSTIKSDLAAGQSLAQIATAEGKDPNGLVSAIVTAITPQIQAAEANGKLSATQESNLLAQLTQKVTDLVNKQFTGQHGLEHALNHHR